MKKLILFTLLISGVLYGAVILKKAEDADVLVADVASTDDLATKADMDGANALGYPLTITVSGTGSTNDLIYADDLSQATSNHAWSESGTINPPSLYNDEYWKYETASDVFEWPSYNGTLPPNGVASDQGSDGGDAVIISYALFADAIGAVKTSDITPTVTSGTNTVPSNAAVEDALDGKVDATDGVSVGTATLQQSGATTNLVTTVLTNNVAGYTNGLLVTTKVYNGVTNTYYDLTD